MATATHPQVADLQLASPPQSSKELVRTASAGRLTDERRERVRAAALAEIPRWYNPWAHLGATLSIGLVVLAISIWRLHAPSALEWLVVPAVFLLANGFEWRVHKHVLHRRRWPVQIIYDRHTPMHHMVYVEQDMQVRSWQELRLVLMPALGILAIVLLTAPFAAGVAWLWSANAGWLLLVTASLYMVSYEVFHLAYHLPAHSFIGRTRLIQVLRAHHARHHEPRLMQKYNFNVTIPLFDWILGTVAPDDPPDPAA